MHMYIYIYISMQESCSRVVTARTKQKTKLNITQNAGELFTWGDGSNGALGHDTRKKCLVPTLVVYCHGFLASRPSFLGSML